MSNCTLNRLGVEPENIRVVVRYLISSISGRQGHHISICCWDIYHGDFGIGAALRYAEKSPVYTQEKMGRKMLLRVLCDRRHKALGFCPFPSNRLREMKKSPFQIASRGAWDLTDLIMEHGRAPTEYISIKKINRTQFFRVIINL